MQITASNSSAAALPISSACFDFLYLQMQHRSILLCILHFFVYDFLHFIPFPLHIRDKLELRARTVEILARRGGCEK